MQHAPEVVQLLLALGEAIQLLRLHFGLKDGIQQVRVLDEELGHLASVERGLDHSAVSNSATVLVHEYHRLAGFDEGQQLVDLLPVQRKGMGFIRHILAIPLLEGQRADLVFVLMQGRLKLVSAPMAAVPLCPQQSAS